MKSISIVIGARESPLSKAQVKEMVEEMLQHYSHLTFSTIFTTTTGDQDQKTSLRTLGKTNFFTKEIDEMLLKGDCRIAVHSAKDLPNPLPDGLKLIALTRGVDSSDSLVLRPYDTLEALPKGAIIATSSLRREDSVRKLRADLSFRDIRGNIGQRLSQLETGDADGVVIAEAALIRLGLTHLNRVTLPDTTAPFQGQLAVLARANDIEMESLFAPIDTRTILYVGLDLPIFFQSHPRIFHCPLIRIVPRDPCDASIQHALRNLNDYSHLIFTSKNAVNLFFKYLPLYGWHQDHFKDKYWIAVGKSTAAALKQHGCEVLITAQEESAEGLIKELQHLPTDSYIFWPHSSRSRTVLTDFFVANGMRYCECIFYDTVFNQEASLPKVDKIDEVIFTSPSTVEAYLSICGELPVHKILSTIGPVTYSALSTALSQCY